MLEYTLNYNARAGYIVVKLNGSIRSDESLEVFTEVVSILTEKIAQKTLVVVFDFTLLKLINSSGIGKMLVFNKYLLDQQSKLYLVGVTPSLRQLFKFARIDQLLQIFNSVADLP